MWFPVPSIFVSYSLPETIYMKEQKLLWLWRDFLETISTAEDWPGPIFCRAPIRRWRWNFWPPGPANGRCWRMAGDSLDGTPPVSKVLKMNCKNSHNLARSGCYFLERLNSTAKVIPNQINRAKSSKTGLNKVQNRQHGRISGFVVERWNGFFQIHFFLLDESGRIWNA